MKWHEVVGFSFRAAATRCREKRKIWVQQLEKKADDLSNTNAHLQVRLLNFNTLTVFKVLACGGSTP